MEPIESRNDPSRPLFSRGFFSLLATQFLGAANDNILKQVLIFMVSTGGLWNNPLGRQGLGTQGGQALIGLCLTIPFIFLSGLAGQVADRFSKRTVMLLVKVAELPICLIAAAGFYFQEMWLAIGAMVAMGAQSAFYGPAKFGVIPELVPDRHLSRANGLMNMFTNIAVILGSVAAGPISDTYWNKPTESGHGEVGIAWIPGIALLCVAIFGLCTSTIMPRLIPAQPKLRFRANPFATYWQSLREMSEGPLLTVALAWATFYMVSMIALMIVSEYKDMLGISYQQNAYILGVLGIAVAIGSVICGVASGDHIEPRFIPFGAGGMTFFLFLLGTVLPEYYSVCVLVAGVGFSAGFYIVPLQALLQHLSPNDERGRFLATANALSFVFVSLGSIVFWIASSQLGMAPNRIYLIAAGIAGIGSAIGIIRLRQILR